MGRLGEARCWGLWPSPVRKRQLLRAGGNSAKWQLSQAQPRDRTAATQRQAWAPSRHGDTQSLAVHRTRERVPLSGSKAQNRNRFPGPSCSN